MTEHQAEASIVGSILDRPESERPSAKELLADMTVDGQTAFHAMAASLRAHIEENRELKISVQICKRALLDTIMENPISKTKEDISRCMKECDEGVTCMCRSNCDILMQETANKLGYMIQLPQ